VQALTTRQEDLLGILGGLGPLASAEFLKTIYECSPATCEQDWPRVMLYSDPTFPDRTETLLAGFDDLLLEPLVEALRQLERLGVNRIVICCVTLHHLLPRVPHSLRSRIWSLLDVVFEQVIESEQRHLLLCTKGTRQLGIFQLHQQWAAARDLLVLPDEDDQQLIHGLIYQIKKNDDVDRLIPIINTLLSKYAVNSFIAGCTEIHLLAKRFQSAPGKVRERGCIDPLSIIAREVTKESICNK
jgi:aspartate racemase